MSYASITAMSTSASLQGRLIACAATQTLVPAGIDPRSWVASHLFEVLAQDGWDTAWDEAPLFNPDGTKTDAGARNDVITDDMILTSVQQVRNAQVGATES